MREVKQTNQFKRDLKRLGKGRYSKILMRPDGELWQVVRKLANDEQLAPKYRDHLCAETVKAAGNAISGLTFCWYTCMMAIT